MKRMKWMAGLAIALGVGVTGASAQPWRAPERPASYVNQNRIERLRAEIARDRMQLNENLRHGRHAAAQRNRQKLARDQRELNALLRVSDHGRRR